MIVICRCSSHYQVKEVWPEVVSVDVGVEYFLLTHWCGVVSSTCCVGAVSCGEVLNGYGKGYDLSRRASVRSVGVLICVGMVGCVINLFGYYMVAYFYAQLRQRRFLN